MNDETGIFHAPPPSGRVDSSNDNRRNGLPILSNIDDIMEDNSNMNINHYNSFPNLAHSPVHNSSINAVGEEKESLLKGMTDGLTTKVYKRRWYVLILFSLFACTQNALWNTWGPISTTSEEAFGWSDATIAWMNNWGPISYILSGLFFPWLLQVKGLRIAVLSSSLIQTVGATFRVITSEPQTATILIHVGQFLNGLGGPVAMGAIPHLSATWFPPKERVTATAIGTSIGVFGGAIAFVLGPALVSGHPPIKMKNVTTTPSSHLGGMDNGSLFADIEESPNVTDHRIHSEREEIMHYMYYMCGWAWLITLIILVYFPSKPPVVPCVSANVERDNYWSGLWSLKSKGYFLIVAFVYGISLGVVNCWASVLNVNLQIVHVSEDQSGWIGFYATLSACFCSLLIGRFADYFTRSLKLFIIIFYLLGTGAFVVFALMLINTIPYSVALLYSTIILGMTFTNAAVPLMFELACELAYPTSEGAANGFLTFLNNIGGLVFLGVLSIPNIGKMWMNWTVIGACGGCIPLIALLKDRFNRLEVDEKLNVQDYFENEVDLPEDSAEQAESR